MPPQSKPRKPDGAPSIDGGFGANGDKNWYDLTPEEHNNLVIKNCSKSKPLTVKDLLWEDKDMDDDDVASSTASSIQEIVEMTNQLHIRVTW